MPRIDVMTRLTAAGGEVLVIMDQHDEPSLGEAVANCSGPCYVTPNPCALGTADSE
ncbi:hypothetical protein GCM10010464_54170 [Pseudonocardia yunnanensis]